MEETRKPDDHYSEWQLDFSQNRRGFEEYLRANGVTDASGISDEFAKAAKEFAKAEFSNALDQLLGQTIGHTSNLKVVRRVGTGGMGAVFEAKMLSSDAVNESDRRSVALKLMNSALFEEHQFWQEAKFTEVFETGDWRGFPYYTTEFVPGFNLAESLLSSEELRSTESAIRIVQEIASDLAKLHEQGLVHRDVKPSNVILDEKSGRARLTDYGLIVKKCSFKRSKTGTPGYVAPEQLHETFDSPDERVDIFAAGIVLYQLLTGKHPFVAVGDANDEIEDKIIWRSPESIRRLNPSVPVKVEQACLKCLAKNPSERFATATELSIALHSALFARQRFVRRIAIAVGMAIALIGVGTAVFTNHRNNQLARDGAHTAGLKFLEQADKHFESRQMIEAATFATHALGGDPNEQRRTSFIAGKPFLKASSMHREAARQVLRSIDPVLLSDYPSKAWHEEKINDVVFSADGKLIASCSDDETIKVWDANTFRLKASLHSHTAPVRCVAFAPDGRHLVSADVTGTIVLWNVDRNEPVAEMKLGSSTDWHFRQEFTVEKLVVSSIPERVLCRIVGSTRDRSEFVDLREKEVIWTQESMSRVATTQIALHQNKPIVGLVFDNEVKGHRVYLRKFGIPNEKIVEFSSRIKGFRFGSEGSQMEAILSNGRIETRSIDGTLLSSHTLDPSPAQFLGLRVSALGPWSTEKYFAVANRNELAVWSKLGKQTRMLMGSRGWIRSHAVSPQENILVAAGDNYRGFVFSLEEGALQSDYGLSSNVTDLAFRGNQVLSMGSHGTMVKYDDQRAIGCRYFEFDIPKSGVYSRDGRHAALVLSEGVEVWDLAKGVKVSTLPGSSYDQLTTAINDDGTKVAIARHRSVKVYDVEGLTETPLLSISLDNELKNLRFTADSRCLVALGSDTLGSINALGLSKRGERNSLSFIHLGLKKHWTMPVEADLKGPLAVGIKRFFPGRDSCSFSGTVAAATSDELLIWNEAKKPRRLRLPNSALVSDLDLSSDGESLAIATNSGILHIVDDLNSPPIELNCSDVGLTSVAYNKDGSRIAVGNRLGRVQVFGFNVGIETTPLPPARQILASGERIALVQDPEATIFELPGLKQTAENVSLPVRLGTEKELRGRPSGVASSKDFSRMICETDRGIEVVQVTEVDSPTKVIGKVGATYAISENGNRIAIGVGDELTLFSHNRVRYQKLWSAKTRLPFIRAIRFSPNGKRAWAVSFVEGRVGIDDNRSILSRTARRSVSRLQSFSCNDGEILSDVENWPGSEGHHGVMFDSDGLAVLNRVNEAGDKTLKVVDLDSGDSLATCFRDGWIVTSVSSDPLVAVDRRRLAALIRDHSNITLKIWDLKTGELQSSTVIVSSLDEVEYRTLTLARNLIAVGTSARIDLYSHDGSRIRSIRSVWANGGAIQEIVCTPDGNGLLVRRASKTEFHWIGAIHRIDASRVEKTLMLGKVDGDEFAPASITLRHTN